MNIKAILSIIATIAAGIACACRKAAGEESCEEENPITTRTVVEGTPDKGKPGKKKPAPAADDDDETTVEVEDDDESPTKGKKPDLAADIRKAIGKLFEIDEEKFEPKVVKIFKAFSIKSISDAEPEDLPAILAAIKKIPVPTSDD